MPALTLRSAALLVGLLLGIGIVTFALFENRLRLEYLVFPLIMVAAWRFHLRGAAPAALMASGIAIWSAVQGTGPFATETLVEKMITLQVFNVCVALTSFVLATFVATRQRQEEVIRRYAAANAAGGKAELLVLPDIGVKGNTHMLMQDDNSLDIADILLDWIGKHVTVVQ